MKLEDQVCSLSLSKKLKNLGVKQDGYFCYADTKKGIKIFDFFTCKPEEGGKPSGIMEEEWKTCEKWCAFTVGELGDMMIGKVAFFSGNGNILDKEYRCEYGDNIRNEYEKNESNTRAKILIYLYEKNIIK